MTLTARLAGAALASLLLAAPAFAQGAAKTDAPAAEKAAPADKKARSAASLECSKEADAKGLHGKERKKFRSECKKQQSGAATDTKTK